MWWLRDPRSLDPVMPPSDIGQRSANCSLCAKSSHCLFCKTVLFEYSHCSFVYVLSMADCTLQWEHWVNATKTICLKCLLSGPLQKKSLLGVFHRIPFNQPVTKKTQQEEWHKRFQSQAWSWCRLFLGPSTFHWSECSHMATLTVSEVRTCGGVRE